MQVAFAPCGQAGAITTAPHLFLTCPTDTCPEPPIRAAVGGFSTEEQNQDKPAYGSLIPLEE